MNKFKLIRKADELGRIVLPQDFRTTLGISAGIPLEISMDNTKIIIEKKVDSCSFCNSPENLIKFKQKSICRNCIEILKNDNFSLYGKRPQKQSPMEKYLTQ
jgi:Regulators of stationary/sporulation gene expression